MEYRLKLIIICIVFFCLSLVSIAPAHSVVKTLYVDGNLIGDVNQTNDMLKFSVPYLKIGAEGPDTWSYNEYTGDMDEFAVYEGVLDANTVLAHYNAGISDNYTTYQSVIGADNPLLWLKFEDSSVSDSQIAANSGSADVNGVYYASGSEALSQVTGICSGTNALVFPTAQEDEDGCFVLVEEPDGELSTAVDDGAGGVDISIELWARFTDVNAVPENDHPRLCSHNGHWQTQGGYAVLIDNDPCNVGMMGGNAQDFLGAGYPLDDGQWHHIVVTYDSTYVPVGAGTYAYEVKVDDPVLYIQFNDVNAVDDSNNNYWTELSPLVEIHENPPGGMGNAAYLAGGWIAAAPQLTEPALPTDYSDDYEWGPNDITIEFWLSTPQPSIVDDYAELFTDCNTVDLIEIGGDEGYPCRPYASRSGTEGRMSLGDADLSDPMAYTSDQTWKSNVRWHHHVLIWDERPETNEIWIEWYRDAISMKNGTYTTGSSTGFAEHGGPEMDHFLFGGYGSRDDFSPNVTVPYQQYVDELAIYPHVLSAERVEAHYNAWKPKDCEEIWTRMIFTDLIPIQNKIQGKIDRNQDCNIDLRDFADFALEWALCNEPGGGTGCSNNW